MRVWNFGPADNIEDILNMDSLSDLIEEGYITRKKHPLYEIYILNYTNLCAIQNRWNRETVFCRGVIVNKSGRILARPFPKFFDIEKYPSDDESFRCLNPLVSTKLDGSLGILFPHPEGYGIASRGSFDSPAALSGSMMLDRTMKEGWTPREDFTYLFEIVAKNTENIVKYRKGNRGLYFLASLFTRSGHNIFEFGDKTDWPGPKAKMEKVSLTSFEKAKVELMTMVDQKQSASKLEGSVVYFPNTNQRMKIKTNKYRIAEREAIKSRRKQHRKDATH